MSMTPDEQKLWKLLVGDCGLKGGIADYVLEWQRGVVRAAVAAQKEKDALVADEQYPWADLPYGHSAHNKHIAGKQIAKAIRESK